MKNNNIKLIIGFLVDVITIVFTIYRRLSKATLTRNKSNTVLSLKYVSYWDWLSYWERFGMYPNRFDVKNRNKTGTLLKFGKMKSQIVRYRWFATLLDFLHHVFKKRLVFDQPSSVVFSDNHRCKIKLHFYYVVGDRVFNPRDTPYIVLTTFIMTKNLYIAIVF